MKIFKLYAKNIIPILFTSFFIFNTISYAEEIKIAILDNGQVFEKSEAFNEINSKIKQKSDSFGDKLRKSEANLRKNLSEIEKQKSVLSEDALKKKNDDLNKGFIDLQQKAVSGREALQKSYEKVMKSFIEHLNKIISKIAEDTGYSLVLDRNASQYFDKKLDITDKVIENLNKDKFIVEIDFSEIDNIEIKDYIKTVTKDTTKEEQKPTGSKK
ncbi:OmpH/Skp family outer membrane protein [Lyticum sinuosum]|uniref:OmpH family outer membrane protein n=1 Tax=Lyticum sinuosum TaxID=1332059 RepID=A0AAE5AHD7_9RICK|nr:OmpH family outer membrane protein [Lyticum sinuosum]MDZ5760891.1 OmpH family outer membrane protein [Lyticum sinuosum]